MRLFPTFILAASLTPVCAPAAHAQLPVFDPSSLTATGALFRPAGAHKRIYRRVADEVMPMGEAWEEIRDRRGSADHVLIRTQRRELPAGTATDTVFFRARDFAPLRRISRGADGSRWDLDFQGAAVEGTHDGEPVEFAGTAGRDFFDSNALDYVCAELALRGSGAVTVPFFSESEGGVVEYRIEAVDLESVEGSAGTVEAVRVDYTHPSGRTGSVWVDRARGVIVREGGAVGPDAEIFMVHEPR